MYYRLVMANVAISVHKELGYIYGNLPSDSTSV